MKTVRSEVCGCVLFLERHTAVETFSVISSDSSCEALAVEMLVCSQVGQSTTSVQTKVPQQLLDGLAHGLVQTFVSLPQDEL